MTDWYNPDKSLRKWARLFALISSRVAVVTGVGNCFCLDDAKS
jgi:hypothetical protein